MKILLGIGALVVVLAGGWFLVSSSPGSLETSETQGEPQESSAFTGTLADLASRGGSYRCSVSQESDVASTAGTVLVDGGRVRGDFTSTVVAAGGLSVETHIIIRDDYTYTWTPIAPTGFRARVAQGGSAGDASLSGQYADFSQAYSYECDPWSVDESAFELPPLTFIDVN